MAEKTPAQLSDDAYEAVRALNHATLSERDGWQYPGHAYSTVANLSALAGGLPQALGQLESLIGRLEDADRLKSDKGPEDLPSRLIDFHGAMGDAIRQAHALYKALDRAHQALGPLAYADHSSDGEG
ncbi:hypothetical protein [Streptomyces caniscabiei]|uniref:Uncharacterized protein n=1 Tax=Streptomyces caniscabiei TaxID=2746961 RepID=A0ABU4MZP0_9ACTN|nr:hypothetical protein [Streptomyces caniscabiei]MBE4790261.1 hypothetical protein [Streptomyces caniscabiei]MBE4799510.1 hypothetical protein [Streptomyces caniscabiei]MDX3015118.1 hypothetical protein [Streptomyces caniscabiei]MDX3042561.1 hypothetical protein [Streptomyces caniscabiei]